MDTINGTGMLVIGVILVLVIVSTLLGANLLSDSRVTVTTTNESGYVNQTGYTLSLYNNTNTNFQITAVWIDYNQSLKQVESATPSGYNVTIDSANYTFASGVINNATVWNFTNASISYTHQPFSEEEVTANMTSGNFTAGIQNVASKIPTILLIVAVVFLFGALVLLVAQAKRMGLGTGGSL